MTGSCLVIGRRAGCKSLTTAAMPAKDVPSHAYRASRRGRRLGPWPRWSQIRRDFTIKTHEKKMMLVDGFGLASVTKYYSWTSNEHSNTRERPTCLVSETWISFSNYTICPNWAFVPSNCYNAHPSRARIHVLWISMNNKMEWSFLGLETFEGTLKTLVRETERIRKNFHSWERLFSPITIVSHDTLVVEF